MKLLLAGGHLVAFTAPELGLTPGAVQVPVPAGGWAATGWRPGAPVQAGGGWVAVPGAVPVRVAGAEPWDGRLPGPVPLAGPAALAARGPELLAAHGRLAACLLEPEGNWSAALAPVLAHGATSVTNWACGAALALAILARASR